MTDLTRRTMLAGAAAVPAASSLPAIALAAHADRGLIELERQHQALHRAANDGGKTDEMVTEIVKQMIVVEWQISRMPATTLDGVAVKLRLLAMSCRDGEQYWCETCCQSALDAVTRLSRGGVS